MPPCGNPIGPPSGVAEVPGGQARPLIHIYMRGVVVAELVGEERCECATAIDNGLERMLKGGNVRFVHWREGIHDVNADSLRSFEHAFRFGIREHLRSGHGGLYSSSTPKIRYIELIRVMYVVGDAGSAEHRCG